MANEKLMILKMLEEGKISAEEAARLMDATGPGKGAVPSAAPYDYTRSGPRTGAKSYEGLPSNDRPGTPSPHMPSGHGPSGHGGYDYGRQAPPPSKSLDDFTQDLGRKIDTFAKDMEPKIQRITETVVEKTANMADMISKSMAAPPSRPASAPRPAYGTAPSGRPAPFNVMEKNFEMLVAPGYCELNLKGLNGDMFINGYNGDKITAKITYRAKRTDSSIELMKLGDKYYLNYDEDEFEFVTVDAYVPEKLFKNVKADTVNGKIYISTLTADYINVLGINAKCELKNIAAGNLNIDSSNGDISLLGITANQCKAESFNGSVTATSLDAANFSLNCNNSPVLLNIDYFRNFSDYNWTLENSNGKLVMNVPSSPELGYYVKAATSLNTVKLGLTGMNYIANTPSFAEAKSYEFDKAPKKVRLNVETSNAPLIIN